MGKNINMKVVLLAGGFGTRLSEYTKTIPKPMIKINGKPMLLHIMHFYAKHGFKNFYIALGYKAEVIKDYFLNYHSLNSDFTVDLSSGSVKPHQVNAVDWKVTLADTGDNSMTGGRVKRMQSFIGNETCMITYGDGVADINIDELLSFHKSHGKMVTMSAVRPAARFGELELDGSKVTSFQEKPQLHNGWINGGYFVLEPSVIDYIDDATTVWEQEPLEKLAKEGQISAYQHTNFWQPLDTLREKNILEELWDSGNAPWKSW